MNKITFSHKYYKLFAVAHQAPLVMAIKMNIKDLPDRLIEWDTAYGDFDEPAKHYDLSKLTEVLVLLFLSGDYLFTTIRRWTPQKEAFYRSKIGQIFEIEIKEEK